MKKEENFNSHGKTQGADTSARITQVLKLSSKDFKADLKIFSNK